MNLSKQNSEKNIGTKTQDIIVDKVYYLYNDNKCIYLGKCVQNNISRIYENDFYPSYLIKFEYFLTKIICIEDNFYGVYPNEVLNIIDENEYNWMNRYNYIMFIEGINFKLENILETHILHYLCNELLCKEICSYL